MINKESEQFIEALKTDSITGILSASKTDLHNHAGRSGNPRFIENRASKNNGKPCTIPAPPATFSDLNEMQQWYNEHVKCFCPSGPEGQLLRFEAGFAEAGRSNIKVLTMSYSRMDASLVGGMRVLISSLNSFHEMYCKDTLFLPELTFSRHCCIEEEAEQLDEILSYRFFTSIDICNGEQPDDPPYKNFRPLYEKAEKAGLCKRAHVGEFGTAEDVQRAVEELSLDEVHHGIAAASSPSVIKFLADQKITLNLCPSSNVMLKTAPSYAAHPIQTLYRNGVPVTINTDDLLIFNQTIGNEYRNLFRAGTLTAEELNDIRIKSFPLL